MRAEEIHRHAEDHITCLGTYKPPLLDCTGNLYGCRIQGKAYGCQAKLRSDNPYPKWTAEHEWFDAGWIEELEELCGDGNGDLAII